jgi:hypothetical protein
MPGCYTDPQKLYLHFPHHPVEPPRDDYHCPCCPDHYHGDFRQMDGIWADIIRDPLCDTCADYDLPNYLHQFRYVDICVRYLASYTSLHPLKLAILFIEDQLWHLRSLDMEFDAFYYFVRDTDRRLWRRFGGEEGVMTLPARPRRFLALRFHRAIRRRKAHWRSKLKLALKLARKCGQYP